MYEYIDKNIETVKKNIKAYFHNSRLGLLKFDELNVSRIESEVDELFDKVERQADRLIEGEIKSMSKKYGFMPNEFTTAEIFSIYNPTTLYVHKYEMERKRERYKENVLSSLIGSGQVEVKGKPTDKSITGGNVVKGGTFGDTTNPNNKVNVGNSSKTLFDLSFPKSLMTTALLSIPFLKAVQTVVNNINRQIEETAVEGERYMYVEHGKNIGKEYVRWVTEHDDRVCGDCEERDGKIYPIDAVPPRPHHGCRCELEYATEEEYKEQEELIGNINTGGMRNEIPLTLAQIEYVEKCAREQGYDGYLRYSDEVNTGVIRMKSLDGDFGLITIGTDVYPSLKPRRANERISVKGTMAHEVVGHYEAILKNTTQDDRILEEVQASIRASKFGVNLTDEERKDLWEDAMDRLKNAGIKFDDVKGGLDIYER